MRENTMVIVDGNSLINRAYFAMANLQNSKGVYTGGLHGLVAMIFNLMDQFEPSHFCVAFDLKGPTHRHDAYDGYKGTRKGMPEELAMQMPVIKDILDALSIPRVELQGYEADDLIGTLSSHFSKESFDVNVITGDKDALQLVAQGAKVYITKKGISQLQQYDESLIQEELGISSAQVIDFKGLSGDTSDNIPGIPGIGPKTASKLLEQFRTVENLVQNADQIENKRIRNLVSDYAEQALMSKRLATIVTEVPIAFNDDDFKVGEPNVNKTIELFKHYELNSLMARLKAKSEPEVRDVTFSEKTADELAVILSESDRFSFKFYYAPGAYLKKELLGAGFQTESGCFLLSDCSDLSALKSIFENEAIKKSGFDIKNEYLFLMALGIDLCGVDFDGYIAAYLIDPGQKNYDLSALYFEYTSAKIPSEEAVFGKGAKRVSFDAVEKEKTDAFIAQELDAMARLAVLFSEKMSDMNLNHLFTTVEIPLVKVLADIEFTGFLVDVEEIDRLDVQITEQIGIIEKRIYESAGESFNINSPKQLGIILFEKLGLPSGKKTKTGYSTGHDVLERLAEKYDIAGDIIEYRMYTKLKSTYIDGLRAVLDQGTHRVHTSLNQTIAVTGRLSSTEPNLQNIPIRLPYGRKIRRFFIADPGSLLLDADYSQIELRVLAHLSEDPRLVEAFTKDLDIHTITASQVFKISEDEVTKLQRSRAKEVNFGIIYGMGDFGLSESLHISRKEAKAYIESYFESYPKVQAFMEGIISRCVESGYVETILGRRRAVPDITNKNFMIRSAAERIARNTPIQGSAADIIKLAMIKVYEALKEKKLKSRLILQVHDELILNVPEDELEIVEKLLKESMESAYALSVPLKVEMSTGRSWYDAK
jgi:DNA polymerase-1